MGPHLGHCPSRVAGFNPFSRRRFGADIARTCQIEHTPRKAIVQQSPSAASGNVFPVQEQPRATGQHLVAALPSCIDTLVVETRSAGLRCRVCGETRAESRHWVRWVRQRPRVPSMVSRMMSAWPACRAVSSIMCNATHRRFWSAISGHAHGVSRSRLSKISREAAICSR